MIKFFSFCTVIFWSKRVCVTSFKGSLHLNPRSSEQLGCHSITLWLWVGRYWAPGNESVWDFVSRLNEARNKIVHHLDPGDLDELLVSIVTKLRADYADHLETPRDRFRSAVMYACGYFEGYEFGRANFVANT